MGFIKTISELFESIFKRSSPEVQKKQQMKKLEQEVREFQPAICRNNMLLPNFGEAIFALYKTPSIIWLTKAPTLTLPMLYSP